MKQKYSNDDIIEESGNFNVNELIRDSQINARNSLEKLEWIEYDNFENIEYDNNNVNYYKVALKSLNNSKDITSEFLNEIRSYLKMNNSERIVKLYGITKDSKTNDFMMEFIKFCNISDLGLYKPENEKVEKRNKNVYGVLPYVTPEVLRGKEYMQASDVYSFGIIIYEIFNGLPPYYDMAHDELLAIKICRGLRPGFNINLPQLIENIAKKCVDADPLKRPTAEYLKKIFDKCYIDYLDKYNEFFKQINEAEKFNKKTIQCDKIIN
ncbi:kinase-like domain-containing protein [Rhizophagus diaphanus]|nr:kinase-like domain-containing protein [Rhizophagus diaphanus] [Rhizophagus sp. MUCL 43196]